MSRTLYNYIKKTALKFISHFLLDRHGNYFKKLIPLGMTRIILGEKRMAKGEAKWYLLRFKKHIFR